MTASSHSSPPSSLQPDRQSFERVADLFKVFADATRLSIIQALKAGPLSVGELVDHLGMTQANISKHLRVLHEANVLVRRKQGTQAFYTIADDFVFPLCELICNKLNRDYQNRAGFDFMI